MRKSRKLVALLVAVMMLFGLVAPAGGATLSDISGHWAQNEIQNLYDQGIISGYDGKFNPEGKVTRAEFAKIIANAMKLVVEKPNQATFNDVAADKWFFDFVETAYKAGIVNGMGSGRFAPQDNITREQIAAMFVRALGLDEEAKAGQQLNFKDAEKVSPWAVGYVSVAYDRGLVNGRTDGSFDPQGDATRAEAAAIGKRFLDKVSGVFGTVQGRVTKQDSDVFIKEANITAEGNGMKFVTKSDDRGLYTLLVPAGNYKLTVTAPGYFDKERESVKVVRAAGTTAQLELVPRAEAGLTVTVIDTNAAPIENARVALVDKEQKETVLNSAYKGVYQFSNVKPGDYTLKVSKEDYEPVTRNLVMNGQAKAEGVTLREYKGLTISGSVKNAKGEKVNADKVELLNSDGKVLATQVNVEAFSFSDKLPTGNYTLLASDSGYAVARTSVAVSEGVNKVVEITLNDGYTVTVRVNDATTLNPVTTEPKVEFLNNGLVYNEATAHKVDGNAVSTSKLANGSYTIRVSGQYVVTKEGSVTVNNGDAVEMIRVEQGGTVNGVVYSGTSKITKAMVTLKTATGSSVKTMETNGEGKYQFTGIPAGNYKVQVSKEGFINYTSGEIKIEAGKDAQADASVAANPDSLDVTGFLREAGVNTLITKGSVEVLDRDGRQVSMTAITTGQYGLDLAPGTYSLVFRAEGYETVVKSVELSSQAMSLNVFMNAGGNGSIKVVVKDADTNEKVANAVVTAVDSYGKKIFTFAKDVNGDYGYGGLSAGTYTISVNAGNKFGGESTVTLVKGETKTTTVTVAAVKSMQGKLVSKSGASVNGDVIVVDAQGKVVDVVQTAAGNFTIINLKTGSYSVKALVDGYEIVAQAVTITAEDTVKDNVNFVLNPR